MNKKKILDSFFSLLQEGGNTGKKENSPNRISEDVFVRNMHLDNTENSKVSVPDNFKSAILEKAVKGNTGASPYYKKETFRHLFDLKVLYAFSAAAITISLFMAVYFGNKAGFPQRQIKISSIGSFYKNQGTTMEKGTALYGRGIKISAISKGVIGQDIAETGSGILENSAESASRKDHGKHITHIFFQQGIWQIKTRHEQLAMETWFHFPGGAISPLGTAFNVSIEEHQTIVVLSDGKIETYASDKNGKLTPFTTKSAPYRGVYPSDGAISYKEININRDDIYENKAAKDSQDVPINSDAKSTLEKNAQNIDGKQKDRHKTSSGNQEKSDSYYYEDENNHDPFQEENEEEKFDAEEEDADETNGATDN
ncbi:MAG: hypothetical protein OEV66_08535 [Spirochaetia bacterium]|nr:hypothetical protein [Spirochaetia bacterium]